MIKIRNNMFETNSSSCNEYGYYENDLYVDDCVVEIVITIIKNESGSSNYHILDDLRDYDEQIASFLQKRADDDSRMYVSKTVHSKITDNKLSIQISFEGKYGYQYVRWDAWDYDLHSSTLKESDVVHYTFNERELEEYILKNFNYKNVELAISGEVLNEGKYTIKVLDDDRSTSTDNYWRDDDLIDKLTDSIYKFNTTVRLLPPIKSNQERMKTWHQSLIIPSDEETYNVTAIFEYSPFAITIQDIETDTEIEHYSKKKRDYQKIYNCIENQMNNIEKYINFKQDINIYGGKQDIHGKLVGINSDKNIFGVQFSVPRSNFKNNVNYYRFQYNDNIIIKDVDLTGYNHLKKWKNTTGKTTADIVKVSLSCEISQIIKINDIEQDLV